MWTKGQGVQAADGALGNYNAQVGELRGEAAAVQADQRVVITQLAETLTEIAKLVVPDAEAASLTAAQNELGLGLADRRAQMIAKRAGWATELAAIERDAHFVQRQSLLHREKGGFVREQQRCDALIRESEARVASFRADETFQWLEARAMRRQIETGALSSFFDALTFGGYRESRAKQSCADALGFASYEALEADFRATEAALAHTRDQKSHVDRQRQRLLGLLETHGNLYGWTHDFEARLCDAIHKEVTQFLAKADLQSLHGRVRAEAQPSVAKAHALQKKLDYLTNLRQFLDREVKDREARIHAIAQTRTTWAMKPWEPVRSDKSKWLVALPAAKRASTQKQLRFSRRMHHNISSYDDYDDYDYYLAHNRSFLAYDAFAYASDEPMPYEGFSRGIVPEIAAHRAMHHVERADMSSFRSLDKQAAREEREAERLLEQDDSSSHGAGDTLGGDSDGDGIADNEDIDNDAVDGGDSGGGDGDADAEAAIEADDAGSDSSDSS